MTPQKAYLESLSNEEIKLLAEESLFAKIEPGSTFKFLMNGEHYKKVYNFEWHGFRCNAVKLSNSAPTYFCADAKVSEINFT